MDTAERAARRIAEAMLEGEGVIGNPEPMLQSRTERITALIRPAVEAQATIQAKCEQYWNEPNIGTVEVHAILAFIHRTSSESMAHLLGENDDAK